jgi:hypothetical protein
MPRDDSRLRPDKRAQYDSSETMPFSEWLRRSREPDPYDVELSDRLTWHIRAAEDAEQVAMDSYLNGGARGRAQAAEEAAAEAATQRYIEAYRRAQAQKPQQE